MARSLADRRRDYARRRAHRQVHANRGQFIPLPTRVFLASLAGAAIFLWGHELLTR